ARSTWLPPATAARRTWPGDCFFCWGGSRLPTLPIPDKAPRLPAPSAGVTMTHVAYRGQGPALSDLIGGQVQILFAAAPGTADYIKAGTLRALAVTAASHAAVLSELPTGA